MAVTIISPEDVRKNRKDYIPEVIFDTINRMIMENFDGQKARVYQNDIIKAVCNEETGLTSEKIFKRHYLDIEDFYRERGWKVEYEKPAYCENFPAFFDFIAFY